MRINATNPQAIQDYLFVQWHNPGDILSLLLILGPEIVRTAVAQLAGRTLVPVAFSFGWVAYAVNALLSTAGDGQLMPDTDVANTLVISSTSGHILKTKSWVLGRLLRDLTHSLDDENTSQAAHQTPALDPESAQAKAATSNKSDELGVLRVAIYKVKDDPPCPHGVPVLDWIWFSGWAVILVQFGISIVPWVIHGDWGAFLITAAGNTLALIQGSLPQWRGEKWACTNTGGPTVTLTQGNGSRHAIVILGGKNAGLHLERLARGPTLSDVSLVSRAILTGLALLWILLLITVSGIKQNTWYILGIGLIGSIQNLLAAGVPRKPGASGIHLSFSQIIQGDKVEIVLRRLEQRYPGIGSSLLNEFFPGGLRSKGDDLTFWQKAMRDRLGPNRHGTRIDAMPQVV